MNNKLLLILLTILQIVFLGLLLQGTIDMVIKTDTYFDEFGIVVFSIISFLVGIITIILNILFNKKESRIQFIYSIMLLPIVMVLVLNKYVALLMVIIMTLMILYWYYYTFWGKKNGGSFLTK